MEEIEKISDPNVESDPESDADSRKSSSSSIEYRSSSAEPIAKADSEKVGNDKAASKSLSRSPSSGKNLPNFVPEKDNDKKLSFRRKRPLQTNYRRSDGYFRKRNNQRNNNNKKDYNNKYAHRREYSPSPVNERKTNRRFEIDDRRRDDEPFESIIEKIKDNGNNNNKENVTLKPSDIKNNAKQSAKSFLDMLEERKLNEAFTKQLIVPQETKKIAVKLHTFVNTFSSLNQTDNGEKDKIDSEDRKDRENSPREEGEIRSDSEVKQVSPEIKKVSKMPKKSSVEKVKNDKSKRKKNNKNEKTKKSKKNKKKKRQTSASSDSDNSSASSYSSSDSDSDSSETDSSDKSSSSSTSSTSSSSSSSSSSYSSDLKKSSRKKKGKKQRKRKQTNKKTMKSKKRKTAMKKGQRKKTKKKSGKKMIKTETEQSDSSSSSSSSSSASSGEESSHIEDTRMEWPKELILHTKTIPSMQFAMNPKHAEEFANVFADFDTRKLEKYSGSRNDGDDEMLRNDSNEFNKHSPQNDGENDEEMGKSVKKSGPLKLDMNNDYQFHYNYYHPNGFPHLEPDEQHKASSYYAYYQMFNSHDYSLQQLAGWASQQGFNLIETSMNDRIFNPKTNDSNNNSLDDNLIKEPQAEIKLEGEEDDDKCNVKEETNPIPVITTNNISSSISSDFLIFQKMFQQNGTPDQNLMEQKHLDSPPLSPPPLRPKMTVLEATEPVQLPNGVTLPAGTKQIIVHPYNRPFY